MTLPKFFRSVVHRVNALGIVTLCLLAGLTSSTMASSGDYYDRILVGGKYLQRFNDQTRVIYYKLDNLQNSPGWDYTQWNFLKDQIVRDAFEEWSRALNYKLTFRETQDPRLTDIAVHWRNGFSEKGVLGIERPNVFRGHTLINADVEITLTSQGKPLDKRIIKAIALHEIGHALGMNGHSNDPKDIMYPTLHEGVYRLSPRDIETMRLIYSRPAHITNAEGVHLGTDEPSPKHQKAQRPSQETKPSGMAEKKAMNIGHRYFQNRQFQQAYLSFADATRQAPQNVEAQYYTGLSAFYANRLQEAISRLNAVAQRPNPYQNQARHTLAQALIQQAKSDMQQGQNTKARHHLQKALANINLLLKDPQLSQDDRQSLLTNKTWATQHLLSLMGGPPSRSAAR